MKLRCDDEWDEHPLMTAAKWIVPAVIWLLGMWMVSIVVMAVAMGVRL